MGLVDLVIPLVKSVIFPTTSLEKFWIPVTTEAANSPPGRTGMVGAERPLPEEGLEDAALDEVPTDLA